MCPPHLSNLRFLPAGVNTAARRETVLGRGDRDPRVRENAASDSGRFDLSAQLPTDPSDDLASVLSTEPANDKHDQLASSLSLCHQIGDRTSQNVAERNCFV